MNTSGILKIYRTLALGLCLILSGASQAAAIKLAAIDAGFANQANLFPAVGSNLGEVADYSNEYPFINYFHQARPWFSASATEFQNEEKLALDKNGNVKSLAKGQFARTVIFTGTPADPGLAGKTFELFYDGKGTLTYGNVTVISQSPGHDVIQLGTIADSNTELIAIITLTQTDKKNPLRNIRLLPPGGICANNPLAVVTDAAACTGNNFLDFAKNHQRIVFNPAFLDSIQRYNSLRFMDWMRTNNSSQSSFKTRSLPTDQFWTTDNGVPLEVMIALTNLMDMDAWFNIPHLASNSYANSFAKLLNAQLEPDRGAFVEYSNEVWNGQFSQTAYALAQGQALHLDTLDNGNTDAATGMVRFYSKRQQEICDIFNKRMTLPNQFRCVMATQAAVPYFTDEILKFGKAAEKTDVMAIAPYFGDTIVDSAKRDELLKLGVDGVFDWLQNDNNAVLDFGSLPNIDREVEAQMNVVDRYSIPLTSYEGGQHFLAAGAFANDDALNALMDAVNRDPRMKTVYLTYLHNWASRTRNVFHHYVNTGRWSRFGRWGAKEYPSQPIGEAPKYDALMTYIDSKPL